jgi:predicted permease
MAGFASDLKFAVRTLLRSPLFTCVAVFSLALGIGANTAIFTLLDQLILRLLPVREPKQLVMMWTTGPHMGNNRGSRAMSYPMYQDFQQKAEAFSHVFCRFYTPLSISFENETERVNAELVSGNYFQALGTNAAVGRVFTPEEDDRVYKGHPSVVLSHHYWVNRFNGDLSVIGKKILVNNYPMVIVGVSAAGFTGLDPSRTPHLRIPIQMKPLMTPGWDNLGDRRSQWIHVFARMKPGYTMESAKASLQPLLKQTLDYEVTLPEMRDVSPYYRDLFMKRTVLMEGAANGYSSLREQASTALIVLMCMVGLVLVIACTNVANLLIARAVARQKEIAVRLSIGASRGQLVRQLLMESVMLSIIGGIAGLAISVAIIRGLLSYLPSDGAPLMLEATPDPRILAFNFALAVATGVLFGLAPAIQSLRFDLWSTLKDAVGSIAGGGSVRMRKVLVVGQVALSFLLLAGAGLFVKSLSNLKNTNTGFREIDNLVTFQLDPALNGYTTARLHNFYTQLLENLSATPGVKSATYASVPLLHGFEWDSSMSVEGHEIKDGEDMQAFMNSVAPGYWQTMGIPMLEGRDFDRRDQSGERIRTAIVNRKFAEHFFGDYRKAIGRHIGFGTGPKSKLDIEIVGVVENSLYEGPRQGVHRQAFVPGMDSGFPRSVAFYVRTSMESSTMFSAIRREVAKLDASMPLYEMKTLEAQLDESLVTERLIAALSSAFGVLATLLAAVGLYGVMAFSVARRTKEIGLRMALGAKQGSVTWLVMREVLLLLAAGVVIGVPCAYFLSRYVSSQLFGVPATDAWTAAGAFVVLSAVTASAGLVPALRASWIDPIRALRYE